MEIKELIKATIKSYEFEQETEDHIITIDNGCIRFSTLMRILKDDKILLTNLDNNQKYGLKSLINYTKECNEYLKDKVIIKATALNEIGDLIINLEGSFQIEFINNSTGYEPWQIYLKNGKEYIAAAGGKVIINSK